jgi:hypothetical protein
MRANEVVVSPRTVPGKVSGPPPVSVGSISPSKLSAVKSSLEHLKTPSRNDNLATTTPPTVTLLNQNPTPFLRSRKGQSISTLKIDPARGPPPAFMPGNQQATAANPSPPPDSVMQNLARRFVTGGIEADPFTNQSTPRSGMVKGQSQGVPNPFNPVQPSTPGALASLIIPGPATFGPSQHLALIAPNGNPPSIEVALDASHLPFVETARLARPVHHGVVKIRNVSSPPIRNFDH